MAKDNPVYQTLETVAETAGGETVTLGHLVAALGARGFGPLVVMLAALIILPTGAIPGVPALVGAALILLAAQLMIGWRIPWLPERLARKQLDREKLLHALEKARPVALRLGRVVHPRAKWLASGPVALRAAGSALILGGIILIPIGFIPFLPLLVGFPVLAIGLGLLARDGLFMVLGFAAFLPVFVVIVRQFA